MKPTIVKVTSCGRVLHEEEFKRPINEDRQDKIEEKMYEKFAMEEDVLVTFHEGTIRCKDTVEMFG